jgi:Restriction endonuclease fold toxin 9
MRQGVVADFDDCRVSARAGKVGRMKKVLIGCAVMIAAFVAVAYAGGDWSAAKDKVDRFKSDYDSLRRLTPDETKRVVTSVCEADEEERASVASDVASRVASTISDKYNSLQSTKDEALRKLDEVISDDSLKDKQSDARSAKDDVQKWWDTIDRMTRSIRGKNHPVVRYLIDEGNRAHKDRQSSSSYCTVSEFSMDSGRADCIYASNCTVIELKPDNSRAVGKGRDQARRYADELNSKQDTRKKLIDKNSDFSKCEKFDFRVDCYKLCPDIDSDTNEMKSTSVSWRTGC